MDLKGKGRAIDDASSPLTNGVQIEWSPSHVLDPPRPPSPSEQSEDLKVQQVLIANGEQRGPRQRTRPRRTVDYFGGLERWKVVR